jgi:hypothetical protein
MPEGMEDVMKDKKGDPLKLLVSNTNFYSGELTTLDGSVLRKDINGKVYVNMVKVNELINDGYYPVSSSAFQTWVKPEKSYDGYFSDWIVTLTQATKVGNTEEIETDPEEHPGEEVTETSTGDEHKLLAIGRVFVEDLFKASREDLDFNDAVFDAAIWQTTTKGTINIVDGKPVFTPSSESVVTREAEIYLIAAGGTIPLFIGNGQDEVHQLFEVSNVTMVNTRGQYSEAFGSYVNGKTPVHKIYTLNTGNKGEGEITLNDIPVDVIWTTDQFSVPASLNNARIVEYQKNPETGEYVLNDDGSPVVVTNGPAKAPHIICVPGTAWPAWPTERKNIEDGYPSFKSYVGNSGVEFWNSTSNDSQFSLYEQNVVTFKKENYGDGTKELEEGLCYYTNVEKVKKTLVEKAILYQDANGTSSEIVVNDKNVWKNNNLSSGDVIRVYATSTNQYYWQFYLQTGNNNTNWYINSIDLTPGYYDFEIDDNKASNLLNNTVDGRAALIGSQNLIIKKVVLCKPE